MIWFWRVATEGEKGEEVLETCGLMGTDKILKILGGEIRENLPRRKGAGDGKVNH